MSTDAYLLRLAIDFVIKEAARLQLLLDNELRGVRA